MFPPLIRRYAGAPPPTPSPLLLGASLLAWWDANHTNLITVDGSGLVSSWIDAVQGIAPVQATGTKQPVLGATSFNGRPGVTWDGTDDYLRISSGVTGLPSGADGCELWFVVDQLAAGDDTTSRDFGAIGGTTNNDSRRANGLGSSGTFRARTTIGTGASSSVHQNSAADAFGRHVIRNVVTPTQTWVEVDGVSSAASSIVPNTGASRVTLGASSSTTASAFAKMTLGAMLITGLLSSYQAALLYAFGKQRTMM